MSRLKYYSQLVLLLFACSITPDLHATSNSWDKMNDLYKNCSTYSMSLRITIYEANNTSAISYNGQVKRSGDLMCYSMQGLTTLVNDRYWLFVNEAGKSITYSKRDKSRKTKDDYNPSALIDSLSKNASPPVYKRKEGSDDIYEMAGDKIAYDKIELKISSEGLLRQITYFYNKKGDNPYSRTEIAYSNIVLNKPIPSEAFSEAHYLIFKNGKAIPAAAFAGYKIIDQNALIIKNNGK